MPELITHAKSAGLNLICLRKHVWGSPVIAIDWDGAVFDSKFCPTCGLAGKRVPYDAEDFDGYLNLADCQKIGERALLVFAFVYLRLRELSVASPSEEQRVTFSLEECIKTIIDAAGPIVQGLERLRAFDFLAVEEIPKFQDKFKTEYSENPGERRFKCGWGKNVKLISLK